MALPLVVLLGTGSAAATGLVGGAAGIPVLLSPWWSRRLRHRISSGRAVAVCYLGEALALATVAWAATTGHLEVALLAVAGLVLGTAEALDGPGQDALLADLGDQCGEDRALTLLTARDLFRRVSMVVGPALRRAARCSGPRGRAALGRGGLRPGLGGSRRRHPRGRCSTATRGGRRDLAHRPGAPDVLAGWVVRGTGCALWFGFTLGLALLGAEHGRGGLFLAAGVTAYGAGSVLGTLGVLPLLRVLPVLPTIAGAWALTGACWFVMGRMPSMQVIAVAGFVSGLAVVVGNAGVTAQITRGAEGSARRTLMAGQSVVVNASASLGLLAGGPVLAGLGAPLTLTTTGLLTVAVSGGVLVVRGVGPQPKRPATSAARAPYPPPNRQACTSSGKSWWTPTRSAQPSASGETSS